MHCFRLGCLAWVLSFFALPSLSLAGPGCSFPARTPPKDNCTAAANLELHPFNSRILQNSRTVRVLLPASYKDKANRAKRYPVLYLNDGQDLFDICSADSEKEWQVDETVNRLTARNEIPPLIIVGIDNAGPERAAEYLPDHDYSFDPPVLEVHPDKYLDFLIREVMPFVNKQYRTLTGPLNTAIGGSSFGAASALYAAIKHPVVFGRLLLESPPLYVSGGALLRDSKKLRSWPRRVYVAVGTRETRNEERNREFVAGAEEFVKLLRRAGLGNDRLRVVFDDGPAREVDAWALRLPHALKFLYVDEPSSTPSTPP